MSIKQQQPYACVWSAIIGVILICLCAFLSGCRGAKPATTPTIPTLQLQNNTDTKIIHTETIDTVFVEIPAQSAERTTPEGFSHLETDYAESDARINDDGTLSHSLKNKPQPKPVPVKNSADTIYIDRIIEKPVPVEVPVLTEAKLTKWQQTRLDTWGWLAAALALSLGWTFRTVLITLARRIISK